MADNIVSEALKEGLYTRVVGRRILYYEKLPSTMDRAAEEARHGTLEGTVVLCRQQTAGRGRFQRPWVSSVGNLLLSVVFYPRLQALSYISIISALAVVRTIERETDLNPVIKWPNDVMVKGKKVCGLLVENALEGDSVSHAIVGIGLNVALDPGPIPEIAAIATSLDMETGRKVNVGRLLRRLLHELDGLYVALGEGQSPVEEWRGYLETLGRRVEVRWGEDVVTGHAEGVDEMGHLLLRRDDGTLVTLPAGEVTFQTRVQQPAN